MAEPTKFAPSALRVLDSFQKASSVLVLCHENPDGDTIGSALALKLALEALGKQVVVYSRDGVPYFLQFLPQSHSVVSQIPDSTEFDLWVFVDNNDLRRFGNAAQILKQQGGKHTIVRIDHHQGEAPFANLELVDATSASTGELVLELIEMLDVKVSSEIAICLYTAIATDTGFFRFANTTARSLELAAKLVSLGADPYLVNRETNERHPPERIHMLARVLSTLEMFCNDRVAIIYAKRTWEEELGVEPSIYENFSNYPRSIAGVEVAGFIRELETGRVCKVSLRSPKGINILPIARALGGGGHPNAAGATVRMSLEECKSEVVRLAESLVLKDCSTE